jgi:hypothetical protein
MEISTGCACADPAAEAADARDDERVCAAVDREVAANITKNAHSGIATVFIGRENSKIGASLEPFLRESRSIPGVPGDPANRRSLI